MMKKEEGMPELMRRSVNVKKVERKKGDDLNEKKRKKQKMKQEKIKVKERVPPSIH
jgi:hypothetical protein